MKQKLNLALLFILINLSIYAQKKTTCTINCNISYIYTCPNSNAWKANPTWYNDVEFMTSLGFAKDSKGCWKYGSSNTNVIVKTDDKAKAQTWWDRIRSMFGGAKKTGF